MRLRYPLLKVNRYVAKHDWLAKGAGILYHGAPALKQRRLDNRHGSADQLKLVIPGNQTQQSG